MRRTPPSPPSPGQAPSSGRTLRRLVALCAAVALLATTTAHAALVTAPFSTDFIGPTSPPGPGHVAPVDFNETGFVGGAGWDLNGASPGTYTAILPNTGDAKIQASVVEVSNLSFVDASSFTISTTGMSFTTGTPGSGNKSITSGLSALATGTSNANGPVGGFRGDLQVFATGTVPAAGTITLRDLSGTAVDTVNLATFSPTDLFTLSLTGTYNSPTLMDLSFSVTDADETKTAVLTGVAHSTGEFFGFRTRANGLAGAATITFDNLNITSIAAIPEPASMSVVAFGALLLVGRRRGGGE